MGSAVVGAVSQIASLLRTNYVASGREFKADTLARDLTTPAATGGRTPLLQAALREAIREAKVTHLLCLKTVASREDVVTERRWLRSARASFIGSATAVFLLSGVGEGGALAASGTVSAANRLVYGLGNGSTDGIGRISLTPESD